MAKLFTANDGDYIQLPWGTVVFHNNELHITTDRDDPAGFSIIGANGGKFSWKTGTGVEKVLIQPRQNSKQDGEIYVGTYSEARFQAETAKGNPKALDAAMIEVATINPDGVEFRVPVKMSAGFSGSASADRIQDPTHRFQTIQQGDGNLVVYDTSTSPWTALWNSGTVV